MSNPNEGGNAPAALPPLRDVIAAHGLAANKGLGQHFLLDLNITRKIVRAAGVSPGESVLEVGPGPGGLTRALLESGARVIAVERDARCFDLLAELGAAYPGLLDVIGADALRIDERTFPGADYPIRIVANLPYNISTELLIKWLVANHEEAPLWRTMALMFQKEVADRILAAPGSKTYGRLSVISQAASRPQRAFDLPARAFTPPPKVDSSVVVFSPSPRRLAHLASLERVTQAAFSQRRKMLRASMRALWGAETEARLEAASVRPTDRAEDIAVDRYLALAGEAEAQAVSGS